MKKIKVFGTALAAILAIGLASSCVKDLDVTPIDPNTTLPEDVLNSQDAFTSLLSKCYQGLASSSSSGESGSADISGVDGGYGQYMRAVVNLNEITTDVATCCWNDGNLFDLHNLCWNSSNEFILSMYYRIFYQVSACNEFIRRSKATTIENYPLKAAYIAEARALRLFSYYHAIDMFGNVPFTDENNSVGSTGAEQIKRADLFDWMVTEAKDLLAGSDLAEIGKNEYGRADKGLVTMILAKLYLNAEVWKGEAMYDKCAEQCETIIANYPLHSNYSDLFCADNHLCTKNTTYSGDEIIFVSPQDGVQLRSYGSTNFLIFANTWTNDAFGEGKVMDAGSLGISSGWGGLSLTGAFTSKFSNGDSRAMFFSGNFDQYISEIRNTLGGSEGWKSIKFTNVNHDGTAAQAQGFVDTDFPIFRSADAYLMYAECSIRSNNVDKAKGQKYFDAVRSRSHASTITLSLDNLIDERGRELYFEGFRRQDLIRFNMFTTADYLWDFKGGAKDGKSVADYFNLFPITSGDINANGNLVQNPGY